MFQNLLNYNAVRNKTIVIDRTVLKLNSTELQVTRNARLFLDFNWVQEGFNLTYFLLTW